MVFCGVVTPSQSAAFGQYSPLRNGHASIRSNIQAKAMETLIENQSFSALAANMLLVITPVGPRC